MLFFREGSGTRLQYSCLENRMDGGAWKAVVHGVAEGRTRLSDFTFTFHFHALEKEMATHSNVLAWRIPGMGEPGGLPSMGSHRVRHDWSDLAAAAAAAACCSSMKVVHQYRWIWRTKAYVKLSNILTLHPCEGIGHSPGLTYPESILQFISERQRAD